MTQYSALRAKDRLGLDEMVNRQFTAFGRTCYDNDIECRQARTIRAYMLATPANELWLEQDAQNDFEYRSMKRIAQDRANHTGSSTIVERYMSNGQDRYNVAFTLSDRAVRIGLRILPESV